MQTARQNSRTCISVALLLATASCQRQQSFDAAIAKNRDTFVDKVAVPGQGLPYFNIQTLNPTWDISRPSELVTIPSFKLTDQNGKDAHETLFDNKITVVGFMFTSCQGFCPFVVQGMKGIAKEFKDKVQYVAFTVDPENDTSTELKAYAKRHGLKSAEWHLLTGDKDTIYSLAKKTFASQTFKKPSKDPNFIHSEHLYVIGPDRKLRAILNGTRVEVANEARSVLTQLLPKTIAGK